MTKVLVVDDKQLMRDSVAATLSRAGFAPIVADSAEAALRLVETHRPAAIVTDLKMGGMDGLGLLRAIRAADAHLPVILMTAYATVQTAVQALKQGACDYLQKPFEGDELVAAVRRAVERDTPTTAAPDEASATLTRPMIGDSSIMREVREQIGRVAAAAGTVLITGESGTGKELAARAVHAMSTRSKRPMVCVNCAALSETLLESELFGHEKGAFTGADQPRKGRFELADGGTLLLDEVSEISPRLQAKLLRVLQEREFERVGSSATIRVDTRVIATTNRDLEAAVRGGDFRQDLYFRLNVLPVHLPPLRHRIEDVENLAAHFLGEKSKRFSAEAVKLMRNHDWPGNVRELQNVCERAAVLTPGNVIYSQTIAPWLQGSAPVPAEAGPAIETCRLEDLERQTILQTLDRYNGHRQRTAEALGIGVRTLGLKLRKWKEQNLVAATV